MESCSILSHSKIEPGREILIDIEIGEPRSYDFNEYYSEEPIEC